jgi:hypothetical protein
MMVSATLLLMLRLVLAFYHQKRTGFKMLRVGAALIILGFLIWCVCQKYLFITSVFPVLSLWLGIAAFVFSIVLLLSAAVIIRKRKKDELK